VPFRVDCRQPFPYGLWKVCLSSAPNGEFAATFMTQALARAGSRHNYNVELLYRRWTQRECSLFCTVPSRRRP
jgi:hypothetical protein